MTTVEEIYGDHADFVWRTLRRLGVPDADAGDAAQEVFLIVHRKLDSFEGKCSMTTWLFAICRGVASGRRRRAHVRNEVTDDEALDRVVDIRADAGARLEHSMRLELLERALDAMEATQREVFVLFELEGMNGDEVAEAVGAPLGTVYSRLRLARERFRAFLQRVEARGSVAQRVEATR